MFQPRPSHPSPDQSYLHSPSSSTYSMDVDLHPPVQPIMAPSPPPPPLSQRAFIAIKPPIIASPSSTANTIRTSTLHNKPTPTPIPTPAPAPPSTTQTRYMTMLVSLSQITRIHNILACFFTYLLLLGFVIIPGSFPPPACPPSKG
ncbi:hypothetical protein QBC34DRAFT_377343 [Podospora aff. communis PSN243]|uniref:Uncharacterized protein n=1 Tax=Podospora aff. communis PSN243 TaxID=3040156 RepID=A0AAV9GWP2_9PEZI|nr:hypothetical protein QBC34DRAFT_377343 [Podospora aff. communis PSN243]